MTASLSNIADNPNGGIHKIKCKDCDSFLEYESVKGNFIKHNIYLVINIVQTK